MNYSNGQCYLITQLYSRFFYAIHTTNFLKVSQCAWRWLLASHEFVSCTHSCFHNTTSVTKDDGCASFHTDQVIELGIFNGVEVEVFLLDPTDKLTSCDGNICIHANGIVVVETSCRILFFTFCFCFFSSTRVYRYGHDVMRIDAFFLCKVCFNHSRFHSDTRTCGRQVRKQFWEVDFRKAYPRWAAACELRNLTTFVKTLYKLRGFFHDC